MMPVDMWYIIGIIIVLHQQMLLTLQQGESTPTCQEDPKGVQYRGDLAQTINGRTCQAWTSQEPHAHTRTPANYPNAGLDDNFCRNPDNEATAWCYTTNSGIRWELCAVGFLDPRCQETTPIPTTMTVPATAIQTSAPVTCAACPYATERHGESCYYFNPTTEIRSRAVSKCSEYGFHLVYIETAEEQDFIEGRMRENNVEDYWIGLTVDSAGQGVWLDGSSLTYDNTQHNSYNDGSECFRMVASYGYTWHDRECSFSFRYVCEKENDCSTKTTMATTELVTTVATTTHQPSTKTLTTTTNPTTTKPTTQPSTTTTTQSTTTKSTTTTMPTTITATTTTQPTTTLPTTQSSTTAVTTTTHSTTTNPTTTTSTTTATTTTQPTTTKPTTRQSTTTARTTTRLTTTKPTTQPSTTTTQPTTTKPTTTKPTTQQSTTTARTTTQPTTTKPTTQPSTATATTTTPSTTTKPTTQQSTTTSATTTTTTASPKARQRSNQYNIIAQNKAIMDSAVVKRDSTSTLVRCAALCLATESCSRFTFSADNGDCLLGGVAPNDEHDFEMRLGAQTFEVI